MGFLKGVLESVKNENEVTTYDNYLSEGERLNKVLETLSKEIGSGRHGLVEAVEMVKRWLEGYEREVNNKNNEITAHLTTLNNEITRTFEYLNTLKNNDYKQKLLDVWLAGVLSLSTWSDEATEKLGKSDGNLKKLLAPNVKLISKAVETFKLNAMRDNNDLEDVCSNIQLQVDELQKQVMNTAEKEQDMCIKELQMDFNKKIHAPIHKIAAKLQDANEDLVNWMKRAADVLTAIIATAHELYNDLKFTNANNASVGRNVEIINTTKDEINVVTKELSSIVDDLTSWNKGANSIVETATPLVQQILDVVNSDEKSKKHPRNVRTAVHNLKHDATNLLVGMQAAYKHINQQLQEASDAFTDVDNAVKRDLQNLRDAIKVTVKAYFAQLGQVNFSKHTDGAVEGLQDKSKKLQAWIKNANVALNNGNGSTSGFTGTVFTNFNAFKNLTLLLEGLKKFLPGDGGEPMSGFIAMGEDGVARIDSEYGTQGAPLEKGDSLMTFYAGVQGKRKVTDTLRKMRSENGLQKLESIKSAENPGENISLATLGKLHEGVTNGLNDLIKEIRTYAGDKHMDDGIKQKLERLHMLINFDTADKKLRVGDATMKGLKQIEQELRAKKDELDAKPGIIQQATGKITDELQRLQHVLKNNIKSKHGIIERLEDFRDKGIFGEQLWQHEQQIRGLNDISNQLKNILFAISGREKNSLTKIIEEAKYFQNFTIRGKVNKCIKSIQDTLEIQVDKKINAIQRQALTKFAETKARELDDLKTLIKNELTKMTAIIETDAASGTKGLLKAMRTHHHSISEIADQSELRIASSKLQWYFEHISDFMKGEVSVIEAGTFKPTKDSQLVAGLQSRTHALLTHLHDNKRTFTFDSAFRSHLHELTSALSTFDPAAFANPNHPQLLDALKAGMQGLVGEMEKAYVNRYDGSQPIEQWEKEETKTVDNEKQTVQILTSDGRACATVFMSCLPMLLNDLSKVKERCVERGEWSKKHLHIEDIVQNGRKPKNPLGTFFRDCGYNVPTSQTSKQDGELRCKHLFNGEAIYGKLVEKTFSDPAQIKHIKECQSNLNERREKKKESKFDVVDLISCLHTHLYGYYTVNHYATFTATKHPSTIYDMLQWLTGLTHSPVYDALSHQGFSDLFEKKDEDENKGTPIGGILLTTEDDDKLPAYPETITATNMRSVLTEVCHHAEETLISFLGHGHSAGIYACEFNTNTAKLTYPSDPSKCLDLLFEVISRVYNQLFFLFKQCSYNTKLGGWYDCWYGQGVGGSAWNCNTLQCPGQRGEQKADQEHNQKCNQNCDQTAECGLKSPLQSFLEDGLPGFLPHPYSKSNCKPTCTAPGHFGKVCITPMGFNDISGMASRRQQGRHIMDVLREFCGSEHAPLSRLCGLLTCLLTRPPQTLGDMFAFYYNFLNGWHKRNYVLRATHRENAYETAVRDANFKNNDNPLEVHSMFKHVSHNSTHSTGDLFSLVSCDQAITKDTYCGRYLQPCGQHIWTVFSEKHAGNYLSWIVYLTETFYDLLKMLYDDCNNKCGQDRSKCYLTSCAVGCPSKSTSESKTPSQIKYHNSDCRTIVTCKSTLPTFCRYGFVFDSPQSLYGEYGDDKKRTCKDFCRALNRVLSDDKKENDVLAKLKFETIPTFLWNIRQKFFWTTVALWSLSLFYLICVMVGRLDVLHIRSHLRTPSSHRITAQSLLAAAQVGRLAKISYLQP